MAYTSRASFNLRIFCIVFIVCNLNAVVSSIANDTEQGQWCILTASPDTVGSMECKFEEEVQFIQVDYYKPGSVDPPEVAVSCDQSSCEPNSKMGDMLKVRGSPSKQLLTLTLHGVPQEHAGKYRCQAQSVADSQTKEGMCSLRFPNTGDNMETTAASNGDLSKETPTKEFNYLILLVLLVVPIAALVIGLVICKLKSCGPWKKSDEYEKPPQDEESPEQETPLVTGEKENLRKSLELDENEKVEKDEAVELEEEGKTTNENAEEPLIKEEKEEKDIDDNEEEEDDKEKAEEGNDSSSEQKDGDITEATPGNRSEKAPIIATDQSAAQ